MSSKKLPRCTIVGLSDSGCGAADEFYRSGKAIILKGEPTAYVKKE